MKHKTVNLIHHGNELPIDEKIAPLVQKLWDLGIDTANSCEDNIPEGWVWIEFMSSIDAEKFLNLVAEYSEDRNSMYNRIRQEWDSDDDGLFWKYNVHANDLGVDQILVDDEIEEKFTGKSYFLFSFSIRFPQSDLSEIMDKLKI